MQFRNTLGPCLRKPCWLQTAHHLSVHSVLYVEGENMLWVNSLHELTGGHELKRAPWMSHDNMANHN